MDLLDPTDVSVLTILARHAAFLDEERRRELVNRLTTKDAKDVAAALRSPTKKGLPRAAREEAKRLQDWADSNKSLADAPDTTDY